MKEAEVESTDVCTKAFAVISKWRQASSYACVSILRDALHKVGLQEVDRSVFGHIEDWTLFKPEAEAADLSLPGIPDMQVESGVSQHKSLGGEYGWLVIRC